MTTTDRAQSPLPQTAYAVLGLLSFGPGSGYDLKQFADRSISHFYWSPARSQIYGELRRLKKHGLVTEVLVRQVNRPDKRVYRITVEGRELLRQWIETPDNEPGVIKSTLLLKVFLGGNADPSKVADRIEAGAEILRDQRAQLLESLDLCRPGEDHLYTVLTIKSGLAYIDASLTWSAESIEIIRRTARLAESKSQDESGHD